MEHTVRAYDEELDAITAQLARMGGLAEQAVAQRWEVYEEMATRGAHRFPPDARRDR